MDIAFEMGSYGIRVPLKPLLRLALMQGNVELVRKYLADGGDVEARDQKGRSPLMIAAARGSLELCSLLLDHGASVDSVDANGASASDLATAASHHHVLDLLRSGVEPNGVADIHVDWPIDDESSGWEAYEEDTAPEDDAALREAVSQTQSVLERHRFVHPDKDWSALALELPDVTEIEAKRRLFDEQGRADFLQILHTSSMYANVPVRRIEELANEIESSPRGGLFERLSLVLGDLGCILDYSEEDWMLARDASEICAADEELLELSEQFLVDLASLRNDPFCTAFKGS